MSIEDITLDQQIIFDYTQTKSIKVTAQNLNVSEAKVRRHLITAGVWHSKTSDAIVKLYNLGLSVSEIADELKMSTKNVEAYMPYTKGVYGNEPKSPSTTRSRVFRDRCHATAARQVIGTKSPAFRSKTEVPLPSSKRTVHLRLELNTNGLSEEDYENLDYIGQAPSGITRDVLVPSSITLHALHYLIQRAFGWTNSHLHHFALPNDIFSALTAGSYNQWASQCGVYFRFAGIPTEDFYCDSDYDGRRSIRTWLQKKYLGHYFFDCPSESYLANQAFISSFEESVAPLLPSLNFRKDNPSLDDIFHRVPFDADPNTLLERLTVADLFVLGSQDFTPNYEITCPNAMPITQLLHYFYDYGDEWEVTISVVDKSTYVNRHPEVAQEEKPLCIAAKGLSVMDDIGGIKGYCEFLSDLADEKEDAYEIQYQHGWSEWRRNPKNIL